MSVRRQWRLEVMTKVEMPAGEPRFQVRFQPARLEHNVLWDRTPSHSLIDLPVTRDEFDEIEVGDYFEFTVEHLGSG